MGGGKRNRNRRRSSGMHNPGAPAQASSPAADDLESEGEEDRVVDDRAQQDHGELTDGLVVPQPSNTEPSPTSAVPASPLPSLLTPTQGSVLVGELTRAFLERTFADVEAAENSILHASAEALNTSTKSLIMTVTQLLAFASKLSDLGEQAESAHNLETLADAVRDRLREVVSFVKAGAAEQVELPTLATLVSQVKNQSVVLYEMMRASPLLGDPSLASVATVSPAGSPLQKRSSVLQMLPPSPLRQPPSNAPVPLIIESVPAVSAETDPPHPEEEHLQALVRKLMYANAQLSTQLDEERTRSHAVATDLLNRLEDAVASSERLAEADNQEMQRLTEENESLASMLREAADAVVAIGRNGPTTGGDGEVEDNAATQRLLQENDELQRALDAAMHSSQAAQARVDELEGMLKLSSVAEDRIDVLWSAERSQLLAELERLRAVASMNGSLLTPSNEAGVASASPAAVESDDEAELKRLRAVIEEQTARIQVLEDSVASSSTNTTLDNDSAPLSSGVSLEEHNLQVAKLTEEIETLRLANKRLEVSRHEIVKAVGTSGDVAKLPTTLGKDFRRFFTEHSPSLGLSGILTYYKERLAGLKAIEARLHADGDVEMLGDLKVLGDYYSHSIAEMTPHHATIAFVEQRVIEVMETQRRLDRTVQTLRGEAEIKDRRIENLLAEASALREEIEEWRSNVEKLQTEKYQLHGKLIDTQRVNVHVREMLNRLRAAPKAASTTQISEQTSEVGVKRSSSTSSSNSSILSMNEPDKPIAAPVPVQPQRAPMDESRAVVVIQRAYRNHARRRGDKIAERRRLIAREIFETERSYVGYLNVLVDNYRETFSKRVGTLITKEQFDAMFSYVTELREFNTRLLNVIQERVDKWHPNQVVGDVFVELAIQLDSTYTDYVNNYNRAVTTLNECRVKEPFRQVLHDIKERQGRRSLALTDLLIMPIQRVVRYSLLLQELLKRTAPAHPDYARLVQAVDGVKAAAEAINEKKRQVEKFQAVIEVQQRLSGLPRMFDPLVRPNERFVVRDGELCELVGTTPKERRVFLFNDLLLCAKLTNKHNVSASDYEFKWAIPIGSNVSVAILKSESENISYQRDGANIPLLPFVVSCQVAPDRPAERRVLYALSETDRHAWFSDIDKYRRHPSIPVVALPAPVVVAPTISGPNDNNSTASTSQRFSGVFRRKEPAKVVGPSPAANLMPIPSSRRSSEAVNSAEALKAAKKRIEELHKLVTHEQKVYDGFLTAMERMNAGPDPKANQKAKERVVPQLNDAQKRLQNLQRQLHNEEKAAEEMERDQESTSSSSSISSLNQ